jgi:hypothetical protein
MAIKLGYWQVNSRLLARRPLASEPVIIKLDHRPVNCKHQNRKPLASKPHTRQQAADYWLIDCKPVARRKNGKKFTPLASRMSTICRQL